MNLTLSAYQTLAARGRNLPQESTIESDYCIMGLFGESGEVANLIKKLLYRGVSLSDSHEKGGTYRHQLCLELGDCLYYVTAIASEFGISVATNVPRTAPVNEPIEMLVRLLLRRVSAIEPYLARTLRRVHASRSIDAIIGGKIAQVFVLIFAIGESFQITKEEILRSNVTKLAGLYPDRYADIDCLDS